MRILLVEDDPRIVLFVGESLEDAGYSVTVARDGEDGFLDAGLNDYDLVILDLTLPRLDGLDVARRLRAVGKAMPILMLTARDREVDKIAGLDGGADDYLTKPFRIGELLARVRALLRREGPSRSSAIRVHDLELDTATRRVVRAGHPLSLSAREYNLLHYLIHHVGQTLTRAQFGADGVGRQRGRQQRGRGLHRLPAPEDRRSVRDAVDPHRPRSGLRLARAGVPLAVRCH